EQGYAVVITPEDTIALAGAGVDTVRVQAPRLRVSELVERIGERMERDYRRLGVMSATSLSHVDLFWDRADPARARREEHIEASRLTLDADGEEHVARLFRTVRKYEGGELVAEEIDPEIVEQWQEDVAGQAMDMPFLLMTAGRYRYEILERVLIGDHLVFKIGFTPRSRFEPGLDGVVWIDYSDLVIRRMEGRVPGPTPAPLFVAAVPRFVWTQRRVGARWLTDELYAEITMTDLPSLPDRIVLRARMRDYVLDGVSYDGEAAR
ncbi:hypothetical protein KKG45_11125, partial [bacterium]|nr:hypothetical protein [bacterium]